MEKLNKDLIGGRDTDIEQIGYSVEGLVRESFPINAVPKDIEYKVIKLTTTLETASKELSETIEYINNRLAADIPQINKACPSCKDTGQLKYEYPAGIEYCYPCPNCSAGIEESRRQEKLRCKKQGSEWNILK
jgi:hypothetical protein